MNIISIPRCSYKIELFTGDKVARKVNKLKTQKLAEERGGLKDNCEYWRRSVSLF